MLKPLHCSGLSLSVIVFLAAPARGASVAHEGFHNPAAISSVLAGGGHVPTALTAAQVESGALAAGNFDVFVVGRNTTWFGASARYVQEVGKYLKGGGNIVSELPGLTMFFSSYSPDVRPISFASTPQLKVFSGTLHGGSFHQANTPIQLLDPAHPIAAGLPNPFSEGNGNDFFLWIESADPALHVVGDFIGNGKFGFPNGQRLPCMAVGCKDGSSFVFGAWDWADTVGIRGHNNRFFLNAVAHAAQGCNRPPDCNIAALSAVECRGASTTVALDGSASSDPDGDALSLTWSTDCGLASFSDPHSPTPVLTVDASSSCSFECNVTLTVTDGANQSSCSMALRVMDSTAPALALNGPGAMTLECHVDSYREAGASARDACDPTVAAVVGGDEVDPMTEGVYVVTYDAGDACGNAAQQVTRTVTVMDTVPPMFVSLPNDLFMECQGADGVPQTDPAVAAFLSTPQVSDTCDPDVTVTHNAPIRFLMGPTTVTWTARDHSGNPVTASRVVEVIDSTKPALAAPGDVTLESPASTSPDSTGVATASDQCGPVTVTYVDERMAVCGGAETVNRTWTASDSLGNTTSQVQTIRVVDKTPPVIALVGPSSLTLEVLVDSYVEQGAIATDNADPQVQVVIGGDVVDARKLGSYRVTYNARDDCGNAAQEVVRLVQVLDRIQPMFVSLPDDLTVECEGGGASSLGPQVAGFLAAAVATDGGDVRLPVTHNAPAVFPLGLTTVTWEARDLSGNPVTAWRTVNVVDSTAPVLVCPVDVTMEGPGATGPENTGMASAVDACSGAAAVTFADVKTPGCAGTETITRTWKATDATGNATTAVQTIRVVDSTAPVVVCSLTPVKNHRHSFRVEFSAEDASGAVSVSAVLDTGAVQMPVKTGQVVRLGCRDFAGLGRKSDRSGGHAVRLMVTAVDGCGNAAACQSSVTVRFGWEELVELDWPSKWEKARAKLEKAARAAREKARAEKEKKGKGKGKRHDDDDDD